MIWFNIKALRSRISNNELTDKDGFNYLLAFITLSTILSISLSGTDDSNNYINLAETILTILINVWGLKTVYEANNEIDGKDFFKRFFATSWVIVMRTVIPAFILGTIGAVITEILIGEESLVYDIVVLLLALMIELTCYLLIINSFRKLKTTINS